MQLTGILDAAGWFDILAIYNLKFNINSGTVKQQNITNFEVLARIIKEQIGESKFNEIIDSDEYEKLYEINSLLYDLVNRVKGTGGIGEEIDKQNHNRFLTKKELQNKYFNSDVSEVKIGYK